MASPSLVVLSFYNWVAWMTVVNRHLSRQLHVCVLFIPFLSAQVLGIHVNRWKLDLKLGVYVLLLYAIFLCFSILIEFNIFTFVNLPMCQEVWNVSFLNHFQTGPTTHNPYQIYIFSQKNFILPKTTMPHIMCSFFCICRWSWGFSSLSRISDNYTSVFGSICSDWTFSS